MTTRARPQSRPRAESSSIQGIARGGSANLAGSVVTAAAQFALTIVITRSLSGAQAGVFFSVTSLFLVAVTIANFGANTGLVYFLSRLRAGQDPWPRRTLLQVGFLPTSTLSVVLAVALFVLAEPLGQRIAPGSAGLATGFLQTLALVLPLASWENLAVSVSRGTGSMRPNVAVSLVGRPLGQLAGVASVLALGSSASLVWGWSLPYLPAAAAALWWMRRCLGRSPSAGPHRPRMGRPAFLAFWRFSVARALTSILQMAAQRLDIVLVAALSSPIDAALYTAATRFVVIGQMATNALMMATQPRMAGAIARGDLPDVREIYRTTTAWLVALSWPVYLFLIVFAGTLLEIFGQGYDRAAGALALVALAMLVSTAFGMVDTVLAMSGRQTLNLVNTTIGVALQLAIDVALIPHLGVLGAAVGWAVSIVVRNLLGLAMVHVTTGLTPFSRPALAAMALAVVGFLAVPVVTAAVLPGGGWLAVLVAGFVGAVLYAAGLRRLRGPLHLLELAGAVRRRRR